MLIEFLYGLGYISAFFACCAIMVFTLRLTIKMPDELNRKIIHLFPVCSILVWVYAFQTWWISVLTAVAFIALLYPVVFAFERFPKFSYLASQREPGEVRRSLVIVFSTYALIITLCWGLLGEKWLAVASVFAWGFGDAAAALVGKRFGRHYIEGRLVEGRKSIEGSVAMFVVSFLSVIAVLLVFSDLHWYAYIPISCLTALGSTAVELYTKRGLDTLTCPVTAMLLLVPLVRFWGAA